MAARYEIAQYEKRDWDFASEKLHAIKAHMYKRIELFLLIE